MTLTVNPASRRTDSAAIDSRVLPNPNAMNGRWTRAAGASVEALLAAASTAQRTSRDSTAVSLAVPRHFSAV